MAKTILITGADGFIGSHLTETLVKNGNKVRALAFYNSFGNIGWLGALSPDVLDCVDVIFGDIRDASQMAKIMCDVDCVMHLAALISIPYSYLAPRSYIETNVTGTLNILQAAMDNGVEVLHTSTSEVYGTANYTPMDEAHQLVGQSPYSASKIAADQLAQSFFSSFELPVKIIRPFNTYGPRQSVRAVIPSIITQLQQNNNVIQLGSLTPTRDFNFISDTVNGFVKASNSQSGYGEAINIGGFEISIGDLVELISSEMNVEVEITSHRSRHRPSGSEVYRLCASNVKAQKLLNWQPEYSGIDGLKRGIRETISWFNETEHDTTQSGPIKFV